MQDPPPQNFRELFVNKQVRNARVGSFHKRYLFIYYLLFFRERGWEGDRQGEEQ